MKRARGKCEACGSGMQVKSDPMRPVFNKCDRCGYAWHTLVSGSKPTARRGK